MKASALILSFLFIVLSIQPTYINWNNTKTARPCRSTWSQKKTCCRKPGSIAKRSAVNHPLKKQSQDLSANCNPCVPCNASPYAPEKQGIFISPGSIENIENAYPVNDIDHSDYNGECWYPTELFYHL